jgi:hypothetical protein
MSRRWITAAVVCGGGGGGPPPAPGAPWTNTPVYECASDNGDGCYPVGLVVNSAGVLYGTTQGGGNPACTEGYGCGTIFRLAPPTAPGGTRTESVAYSFNWSERRGRSRIHIDASQRAPRASR